MHCGHRVAIVDEAEVERLMKQYALDRPMHVQYLTWIQNILLKGSFGQSFQWGRPVNEVIGDKMALTFLLAIFTTIFVWAVSVPIGIYVSVRQYTFTDYLFTMIGFVGLAVPGFLLAMVVMYFSFAWFGLKVGGLFSPAFELEPWRHCQIPKHAHPHLGARSHPRHRRHRPHHSRHARHHAR